MSKRNKKNQNRRKRGTRPVPSTPKVRLKPLFTLFGDINKACNQVLGETSGAMSPAMRFDAAILLRGLNTLTSVRILLERAHWELASAGARQLFELLVNLEYLNSQEDRDAASFRFAKFGLLQLARQQQLEISYETKTGREVDAERRDKIEALLHTGFPEFRTKTGGWMRSWSGKNVRELAEGSKHPIRDDQYSLLFSAWSEQTHGSPGAVIANMFPSQAEDVVSQIMADDDRETIQVAGMSLTLFFELWLQLPNVAAIDREQIGDWMARFAREARRHGAPLPPHPGSPVKS